MVQFRGDSKLIEVPHKIFFLSCAVLFSSTNWLKLYNIAIKIWILFLNKFNKNRCQSEVQTVAAAAASSRYASSNADFWSAVNVVRQAWNTSGLCSTCLTISNMRRPTSWVGSTTSRYNPSAMIATIRGRFELFAPKIIGWLAWIKSHK